MTKPIVVTVVGIATLLAGATVALAATPVGHMLMVGGKCVGM